MSLLRRCVLRGRISGHRYSISRAITLALCPILFSIGFMGMAAPARAGQYFAGVGVMISSHGYHYGNGGGYHGGYSGGYNTGQVYQAPVQSYAPTYAAPARSYVPQVYYRRPNLYNFQNTPRYNYITGQGYYAPAPVYYVAPPAYAAPVYQPVYNQPVYAPSPPQQPQALINIAPSINISPSITVASGLSAQLGAQYVNSNDNQCRMNAPSGDVRVIYGAPTNCDYVPPRFIEVSPQQPDYLPSTPTQSAPAFSAPVPVLRERY